MIALSRFRHGPPCPIRGIAPLAWRYFIDALEVQPVRAISLSGGLGAYDMRPRRLVEIGIATDLRVKRAPIMLWTEEEIEQLTQAAPYLTAEALHALTQPKGNRQIHVCAFVAPWTQKRFLDDPMAQYAVLVRSVADHHKALSSGSIACPKGVSLAGALAILHRGGKGALQGWPQLFDETRALYNNARKAF